MGKFNEEKSAMDAWAEDFISEISQKALANAKHVMSRLVTTLIATEDFSDVVSDKVMRIVDFRIESAVNESLEQSVHDALEKIRNAKHNAITAINIQGKQQNTDEQQKAINALTDEVKRMKREIEELKQSVPTNKTSGSAHSGDTIHNYGQMCGEVSAETIHIHGNGMIVHLKANTVIKH